MKTMKLLSIFAIIFASFVGFESNAKEGAATPYVVVDSEALQKLQAENDDLVIIDSRGKSYFNNEVIAGSVQLSVGDTNEENLSKLVSSKDQKIVFYCSNVNCPASAKAAFKASSLGYTNLYKYPAGMDDWKSKNLPTAKL